MGRSRTRSRRLEGERAERRALGAGRRALVVRRRLPGAGGAQPPSGASASGPSGSSRMVPGGGAGFRVASNLPGRGGWISHHIESCEMSQ